MNHQSALRKRQIRQQVAVQVLARSRLRQLPLEVRVEVEAETAALVEKLAERRAGLIRPVDFPGFVAGLVSGVFDAVLDSSLQQMESYAALLRSVASSIDEFAKDNVSENDGRDHLSAAPPRTAGQVNDWVRRELLKRATKVEKRDKSRDKS